MTIIEFPWPSASLSGHAKGHWSAKSGPTKQWRAHARWLAKAAKIPPQPDGDIPIRFIFNPPSLKIDRVNMPHLLKPIIDGIADHMGINDRRFLPDYVFGHVVKGGKLTIEIG